MFIAPPHSKNSQFSSVVRTGKGNLSFSVSISGLTSNPTHGPTAQVGVELTASVASWPGDAPTSVAWQWYDGSGAISGATSASYTPVAGDDLEAIYPRAAPSDTYDPRNGPSYIVRRAPPVADGTMADRDLVLNSAQTTFTGDLNGRFIGDDLSFSVAGHSTVFVDGTALRCLPTVEALDATITVTATNSGGSATQQFELDITELEFETATLTGTGKVGATHTAAATVNFAGAAFSYDYERDGVSIGATDQDTYVPVGADDETALGVEISATVDGVTISTNTATISITRVAPTVSAAPVISGSPTTGGNLTGTSATFTGDDLDEGDEWQVSDDGSSGWTGTADTDTTSPALVEGKYYRLVSTASNSGGSVSSASNVIGPAVAAPAVATLTFETPGAQDASGDVELSYTIDVDDSGVELVLFLAAEDDPAAADFDGGGAPTYIDLGTANLVTSGGDIDITLPSGLEGNYKFAGLPTGGGDAHVAVSAAVAIDTTGSVLSSVSFTDTSGAADWAFTPDEDSAAATGYRVSLWPDGTDPSDAQIESGTGATATVTGTASDSVAESGTFSSLSAATYQPTIFYQDAFGNKVYQTYSDVVVTAGGGSSLKVQLESDNTTFGATQWDCKVSGVSLVVVAGMGTPSVVAGGTPTGEDYLQLTGGEGLGDADISGEDIPDGADVRTMYAVFRYPDQSGNYSGVVYGNAANNEAFGFIIDGSEYLNQDVWGDGAAYTGAVIDDGNFHVVTIKCTGPSGSGNNMFMYLDGTLVSSDEMTVNTTLNRFYLNQKLDGGAGQAIDIAAIRIYDVAHDDTARGVIEAELDAKYITV